MLRADGITVAYGRQRVLRAADLTVAPGVVTGLAGPSGCGKSTLARVLALLRRPDAGRLTVDGTEVRRWRHRASRDLRTRVALIFQQPRLAVDPRLTLREIAEEPFHATGRPVEDLADEVGLTPELLVRRPHEVSDGQLQRACVARALALRPRYVICDEMTTMLDASTQAHLVARLEAYRRETGAGVLAITHDEELLTRWTEPSGGPTVRMT
ncbi:ATP-binding cassette domain-containing protein [Herbidospora galbida]|uniref:ATP-binding cassette domain-containing protein n=1 Tax=Herbidospora galbida TaxID=2575442 RepID=A0A4U3MEM4_9ACTN|nr:ATP-binding cassette domain-containing protein [Herbidospora galbida]TKK87828.1 ATP-binding cassette domain-containing protein [Herbidospora galbida]